jgi:hypothetical protein
MPKRMKMQILHAAAEKTIRDPENKGDKDAEERGV